MEKKRNYGLDLLRILSMLMVIMMHLVEKGEFINAEGVLGIEAWMMYACSTVAVNCFVLITGYFMSEKTFKLSRVITVWVEVVFWSVTIFLTTLCLKGEFQLSELFKCLLPFSFNSYWFVNTYILLIMIAPLLNIIVANVSKKKYTLGLCVIIGLWCVLNNFLKFLSPIDSSEGYGIEWFCVLYLVGAYIKKYHKEPKVKNRNLWIYFTTSIGTVILHQVLLPYGKFVSFNMVATYNNILVFAGSVSLFLFFCQMNLNNSYLISLISWFSPKAFAVYIIHHAPSMRMILWKYISVANFNVRFGGGFFVYAVTVVVCIFGICSVMEWCREKVFSILRINAFIRRLSEKLENAIRTSIYSWESEV